MATGELPREVFSALQVTLLCTRLPRRCSDSCVLCDRQVGQWRPVTEKCTCASADAGKTTEYALKDLEARGTLFVGMAIPLQPLPITLLTLTLSLSASRLPLSLAISVDPSFSKPSAPSP
eukprot:864267-Rhodomonas_salina.3